MSEWTEISEAREAATNRLSKIAGEHGRDSQLWRMCDDVWRSRESEALTSLIYGDFANAKVILARGLHILTHAPALVENGELPLEEAALLLAAV